ncbi:MAG TPA: hypothetical protein PKG52_07085 [bacterium]|nr:hypothetical protein [bacterium]HPS31083.1 hypothetical protein [bacterium]
MKLTKREIIFGCIAIVLTILLITGINMFFSSLDEKTEDSVMVNDYLEVDRALRTKDACDKKKSAEACLKTGIYYLDGKHVLVNREKAAKYLLKACDLDDAVGCYQLGKFWQGEEKDIKKNKRVLKYFTKACKLGDLESCKLINVKSTGE